MNGKVHYWIVCDAVAYIRSHGDDVQKRALQTLQNAYGEKRPIHAIPPYRSAIESIAGFEAWHTDKFCDLSLYLPGLPWGAKRNVSGLAGRMFTAFNHFISPYPEIAHEWPDANGYAYNQSSMRGFDSLVVKGISDYLHGLVDESNSLVLDRIKPFWTKGASRWQQNFDRELIHTTFAPWSVVVRVYYSSLLLAHDEPLEVRGPNRYLVGLQLLGPVFHAIADSCTPQHIRPALGFGHQVWENYVQSRVYNREIDMIPALVRQILSSEPFESRLRVTDGRLAGMFDPAAFVYRLSVRTADRIKQTTQQTWKGLWQAGENFWRWYLTGTHMPDDAAYLYNQAVAGAVHAIERASEDLVRIGVIGSDGNLAAADKMPRMDLIQNSLPSLPTKRDSIEDLPSEETRPVPFSRVEDILGFVPQDGIELTEALRQVTELHERSFPSGPETQDVNRLISRVEALLVSEFRAKAAQDGPDFCPLRSVEKIPLDSDISAHWGTGSFRIPSSAECTDPEQFAEYIDRLDAHAEIAQRLQLTQAVAALTFYKDRVREAGPASDRVDRIIAALQAFRDTGEDQPPIPALAEAAQRAEVQAVRTTQPLADQVKDVAERIASAAHELFLSLFKVPVMSLATAAAVAVLVLMIIPWGGPEQIVGVSPIQWEEAPAPGLMPKAPLFKRIEPPEPAKPRVAVILTFEGFKPPLDQEFVNRLYRALEPRDTARRKFAVIGPDEIYNAIHRGEIKTDRPKDALEGLRSALNAADALVVTIAVKKDRFSVTAQLTDLSTGAVRRTEAADNVVEADLGGVVKRLSDILLKESAGSSSPE